VRARVRCACVEQRQRVCMRAPICVAPFVDTPEDRLCQMKPAYSQPY